MAIKRRRVVIVAGLATVLVMALGLVGSALVLTRTEAGRDFVRRTIVERLAKSVRGTLHVGRIGGDLLDGVTLDSLEIAERDGTVLVALGRVELDWDLRDLLDRRIVIRRARVGSLHAHMIKYADGDAIRGGDWNYKRIFPPSGTPSTPRPKGSLGDFVRLENVVVERGQFLLTMPWTPADSLKGAKRDSAIATNTARTDAIIRRRSDMATGFSRTWRWTDGGVAASVVRWAHPDTTGRLFRVTSLRATEHDPPFRFEQVAGDVRWAGDTIWLDTLRFRLPGSRGAAWGDVRWGGGRPIIYTIDVRGDSVAMRDIAWLTSTFPREGSGSMMLRIRNRLQDAQILRYAITDMDARSLGSRLRGRMTWAVGGPVVQLTDVDITADPLDFALLREFRGAPFPYPWRGTFNGRVVARGGPLDRFTVDDVRFTFRDANVAGATSTGRGAGGLDILFPADARFRDFALEMERADLRTPRALNPEFAQVDGWVRGRVRLDSLWTDVRARDADLWHDDGSGAPPSHVTGSGRVTLLDDFVRYDLAIEAPQLSWTMLANSYPLLPLRGTMSGPITVRGTLPALDVTATLAGEAGRLEWRGVIDGDPAGDYAARGTLVAQELDLRRALARPSLPATSLSLGTRLDVRGSALATLAGTAAATIDRSRVDAARIAGGQAAVTFADGRVRVDTLGLQSDVGLLLVSGGLGLRAGADDTLVVRGFVDSLGALRPWIAAADDSLAGALVLRATLAGRLDSLRIAATAAGDQLVRDVLRAHRLDARADGTIADGRWRGDAELRLDSAAVAGARFRTVSARVRGDADRTGAAALDASGDSTLHVTARAHWAPGGGDTLVAVLDTLEAAGPRAQWTLDAPATVRRTGAVTLLDALVLRDPGAGRLRLGGRLVALDSLDATASAERVALRDLAWLAPRERPLGGSLGAVVRLHGTRTAPEVDLTARVDALAVGETRIGDATLEGRYAEERLRVGTRIADGGRELLAADLVLPAAATLAGLPRVRRELPVSGTLRLDSLRLGLLEAITPKLVRAEGHLAGSLALSGTPAAPRATGALALVDGSATFPDLGVRMTGMTGRLDFRGDSVVLPRLAILGAGTRGGSATLRGTVGFADVERPTFDVTVQAANLRVLDRPRIASMNLSTIGDGVRVRGSAESATLAGSLLIPRADIAIPELGVAKNLVPVDDPEFLALIDTTTSAGRTLLAASPSPFVRNLSIDNVRLVMGSDVWLRSAEANIKLAGELGVTLGRDPVDSTRAQLALDGALATERGTYRLNLGYGAVQRTFEVERGALRFFGEPTLNPALDITAVYTVRQFTRADRDVPIRIAIGGTLETPTLKLGSADPNLPLSESDAISYLFTGRPSYSVTNVADRYSNQAANLLLPTLGSALGGRVAQALGLDQFQIETAGGVQGQEFGVGSALASTRLGGGVQLGSRTFVRATVGLCLNLFGAPAAGTNAQQGIDYGTLVNSIGAKLEYRFNPRVSASIGIEPPTNVLMCQTAVNARNFVPTPQQFGLDLQRKWEY
jgi:translocation and assembly module TamB